MKKIVLLILTLLTTACSLDYEVDPRLVPFLAEVEPYMGDIYHNKLGFPINYEIGVLEYSKRGFGEVGRCFPVEDRDGGLKAKVVIDLAFYNKYWYTEGLIISALLAHEATHCAYDVAGHSRHVRFFLKEYNYSELKCGTGRGGDQTNCGRALFDRNMKELMKFLR